MTNKTNTIKWTDQEVEEYGEEVIDLVSDEVGSLLSNFEEKKKLDQGMLEFIAAKHPEFKELLIDARRSLVLLILMQVKDVMGLLNLLESEKVKKLLDEAASKKNLEDD